METYWAVENVAISCTSFISIENLVVYSFIQSKQGQIFGGQQPYFKISLLFQLSET